MKHEKKIKEYKSVWTCDFCGKEFKTKKESDKHELSCGKNPQKRNKNKNIIIVILFIVILFLIFKNNFKSINKIDNSSSKNQNNKYSCLRTEPYKLEPEFERARSLREQRKKEFGETMNYDWYNCIDIKYKDLPEEEGLFYFDKNSSIQDITIYVDTNYKSSDDVLTAILLEHEFTHVGQFINSLQTGVNTPCYESEAKAFFAETTSLFKLSEEERKTISQKLEAFDKGQYQGQKMESMLSSIRDLVLLLDKANKSCENNNNSDCFNNLIYNKLLEYVKSNEYYQQQCKNQ